ncbi:MAG: 6-carboxytetrahydropterin synthase [Alphaproteobacteria bacterium]|nr:6-carboxytetrahydropterin synthase [Alphaproteobacteria bacterium]
MYSLTVCDHFMIAHSFRGEVFGPAQRLHGATYAVELEIRVAALDQHGLVADIGRLAEMLKQVLAALNYRNLDDEPAFDATNTTTEFLAGEIWRRAQAAIRGGALAPSPPPAAMKVLLRESPVAWAAFEAPLA